MSLKNKLQRKSKVNLFFNQQINIFPEDFFSTFDQKSNSNLDKSRNFPKIKDKPKTNLYINSRNLIKDKEEIAKNNYTNEIKLENINNIDFSFQAPSSPVKKNKVSNSNKNHSMSAINKTNSFKPLFRSPLKNKIKKYDSIKKNNQNVNQKNNNINEKGKKPKFKCFNVKYNDLFKENKLKFLKRNNLKNIAIYSKKEKENEKNEFKIKNINLNMTSRLNDKSKPNVSKLSNYRLSTPMIKKRVVKKLLNINRSKEIILKSNSIKSINNKNKGIEKEKKIKNKKDISLSVKNFANKKYSNSEVFEEKRPKSKSKIIDNFNKRTLYSLNHCKSNKENKNSKVNKTQNYPNSKNDIKKNIKNTINNIFRDMPKECADNPIILYKFNSLIRNMKNIQHIIQSKKNSFYRNKNSDDNKNNEVEKKYCSQI